MKSAAARIHTIYSDEDNNAERERERERESPEFAARVAFYRQLAKGSLLTD